jgi:hypothetical protein
MSSLIDWICLKFLLGFFPAIGFSSGIAYSLPDLLFDLSRGIPSTISTNVVSPRDNKSNLRRIG